MYCDCCSECGDNWQMRVYRQPDSLLQVLWACLQQKFSVFVNWNVRIHHTWRTDTKGRSLLEVAYATLMRRCRGSVSLRQLLCISNSDVGKVLSKAVKSLRRTVLVSVMCSDLSIVPTCYVIIQNSAAEQQPQQQRIDVHRSFTVRLRLVLRRPINSTLAYDDYCVCACVCVWINNGRVPLSCRELGLGQCKCEVCR